MKQPSIAASENWAVMKEERPIILVSAASSWIWIEVKRDAHVREILEGEG
jgi:hypothetical protein